ncbi:HET-domain-containing protein [Pseudovirgaria hyperparasitica]|uniref:HET-domain-containing protein n=1 Tax=Pseudovirgaria hyperparasitica TaxID=470096 RepID=A0A6A6W471_9PEZI|nr:HET-domain-containing protein [Pseudovirgaria hyperparasitica]KAF2756766.1 HET-domain-containing protein [Pseudovirgaria hyperparasitica]
MNAAVLQSVYSSLESIVELPKTTRLCSACRMLSFEGLQNGYEHPWDHERIARSGQACRLCRLIVCSMGRLQIPEVDSYKLDSKYESALHQLRTLPAISRHQNPVGLPYETFTVVKKVTWSRANYVAPAGAQVCRGNFNQGETISITAPPTSNYARDGLVPSRSVDSASSQPIYDKIRKWLGECVASHKECRIQELADPSDREAAYLPTRVIDLGPPADGSWKPRLLITSGEKNRFVALSHRWGRNEIQTVEQNIDEFQAKLPMQNLSRTFQDAIEVTKQLGCRYLWVDSLCIIQDDKDDWARESDLMGYYFSSSYFTIAAVGAKEQSGCDQGLFDCRDLDPLAVSVALPLRIDPLFKLSETVFKSSKEAFVWKFRYLKSSLPSENMVTVCPRRLSIPKRLILTEWHWRAWIFQERILSRRVLYYTTGKLYWDCFQEKGEEEGTDPQLSYRESLLLRREDQPSTLTLWGRIVTDYSRAKMTYNKDRLKAISGLSNRLHHSFDVIIHAGILEDKTYQGLLWFTKSPQVQPFQDFHAPSWSWASVNAPVVTELFGTPKSCDILARNVSYTTKDGCKNGGELGLCSGTCISGETHFVSAGRMVKRGARLRELKLETPEGEVGSEALYNDEILSHLLGTANFDGVGPSFFIPRYDECMNRLFFPRPLPVPEHTETVLDQCGCIIGFYIPDSAREQDSERWLFCVAIKSWDNYIARECAKASGCSGENHVAREKCIEVLGLRSVEGHNGVYQRIGRGRIICNACSEIDLKIWGAGP